LPRIESYSATRRASSTANSNWAVSSKIEG
jgi:hypothetical protein